jgi:hypothetical protein
VKTNLTLRIEEELVREAKVLAARRGSSVSRLVAEQLEELTRRDRAYEAARRRAEARLKTGYDLGWSPATSRDELHDRASLR